MNTPPSYLIRLILAPEDVVPEAFLVQTIPSVRVLQADLKLAGVEYGNRTVGYVDFHALRNTLSTMMAAAGMSQRVRQAHMRHTDPRLTEGTYMDESLLPVAEELSKVPAIPSPDEPAPEAIPFRATGTDGRAPNAHQIDPTSGHCLASDGNEGGAQTGKVGSAQAAVAQEKSPGLPGLVGKAGERIRTVEIFVGNMYARVTQTSACQEVAPVEGDTRSKYAARNNLRIKRTSAFALGKWLRDPDHARAV